MAEKSRLQLNERKHMIGKVKALTLALVAVCAFGVVAASGASAAEFRIAGMGVAQGDGTQIAGSPTEFVIPEGALKCPSARVNVTTLSNAANVDQETAGQTATAKVEEPGAQPETLNCTFAGLAGSIVHMNGCDFRLHSGPPIKATVICPGTNQITVTAIVTGVTKCTIHIPTQVDLQQITATNVAGGHLDLLSAIQGIDYSTTPGTGLGACTETTTGTDGKFNGKVTVTGTANGVTSALTYS